MKRNQGCHLPLLETFYCSLLQLVWAFLEIKLRLVARAPVAVFERVFYRFGLLFSLPVFLGVCKWKCTFSNASKQNKFYKFTNIWL
jgi:hypothetical protein